MSATSDLAQRVAKLEQENRRWRRGATAGLVLVGAVLLMGQAAPRKTVPPVADQIMAREFVLVGSDGSMRAILHTTSDHSAELLLKGVRDGVMLALTTTEKAATLQLGTLEGPRTAPTTHSHVTLASARDVVRVSMSGPPGTGSAHIGAGELGAYVLVQRIRPTDDVL